MADPNTKTNGELPILDKDVPDDIPTLTFARYDYRPDGIFSQVFLNHKPVSLFGLERPQTDPENQVGISPILEGSYRAEWMSGDVHGRFRKTGIYLLHGVYGRTGIMLHYGNTMDEIEGCILIGKARAMFQHKGVMGVTHSVDACKLLFEHWLQLGPCMVQVTNITDYREA